MDSSGGHPSGQDMAREILVYTTDGDDTMTDFRPKYTEQEATPKNSSAPVHASSSTSTPENAESPASTPASSPKSDDASGSQTSSGPKTTPGGSRQPAVTTTPKSSSPTEEKVI